MRDQKVFLSAGMIDYRLAGLELRGAMRNEKVTKQTQTGKKTEHELETVFDRSGWASRCVCGWYTTANETKAIALDKGFDHLQAERRPTISNRQDRYRRRVAEDHVIQLHLDQERWCAACRCGWTSLPSRRASLALSNGQDHVRRAR